MKREITNISRNKKKDRVQCSLVTTYKNGKKKTQTVHTTGEGLKDLQANAAFLTNLGI